VASHAVLCNSSPVELFLSEADDKSFGEGQKRLGKEAPPKSLFNEDELVPVEADIRLERFRVLLNGSETNLKQLMTTSEGLITQLQSYTEHLLRLSGHLSILGKEDDSNPICWERNCTDCGSVNKAFAASANSIFTLAEAYNKQVDGDAQYIPEGCQELLSCIEAFRELFKSRETLLGQYKSSVSKLDSNKVKLAKARQQNTGGKQDKTITKLNAEVAEEEATVIRQRQLCTVNTLTLLNEIDLFHQLRRQDLRALLTKWIESQAVFHAQVSRTYTELLPVVTSMFA
jgi:hypothetical protein